KGCIRESEALVGEEALSSEDLVNGVFDPCDEEYEDMEDNDVSL
ncbi:hypothetical protein LINPERPRIM_LOCUS38099, partial [Linum perenne]